MIYLIPFTILVAIILYQRYFIGKLYGNYELLHNEYTDLFYRYTYDSIPVEYLGRIREIVISRVHEGILSKEDELVYLTYADVSDEELDNEIKESNGAI